MFSYVTAANGIGEVLVTALSVPTLLGVPITRKKGSD